MRRAIIICLLRIQMRVSEFTLPGQLLNNLHQSFQFVLVDQMAHPWAYSLVYLGSHASHNFTRQAYPLERDEQICFAEDDRHNKLLQVVSGKEVNDALHINQDANIFVSEVDKGEQLMVVMVKSKR